MRVVRLIIAVLLALVGMPAAPTRAETCKAAQLAQAVDATGQALHRINTELLPGLQSRMRQLKDVMGWPEADHQERAVEMMSDKRSRELDAAAQELLARIDTLGNAKGDVDCARIAELEAATSELIATMRTKTAYAIARLDVLIAERSAPGAKESKDEPQRGPVAQQPPPTERPALPRGGAGRPPAEAGRDAKGQWSTDVDVAVLPPKPVLPPGVFVAPEGEGFTIDEIREASRGLFGQVSTGLASVIEYAFSSLGRPTAYVLGNEGGGAFLVGLRYGTGTLYLRRGGTRKVYWHGPSIGYDLGVAGSKTMFLIYNLPEPDALFARFTGIDGSAYLVGGVGVTFLTNGSVVLAPIRSGVGLRFGANIGFVRFTPQATWAPF